MDNIKNKIKQMENELHVIKSKILDMDEQKQSILLDQVAIEKNIILSDKYTTKLAQDLEISKTNRQMNFERLLIEQKKGQLYQALVMGRRPYLSYKTEELLTTEYAKQKELNDKLCTIVHNLNLDFPNYSNELDRMLNSLRIRAVVH